MCLKKKKFDVMICQFWSSVETPLVTVVAVTIQSKGSARFRAVYIQARRQNSSRNQDEPIGHFSYETGYKVACTGAIGVGGVGSFSVYSGQSLSLLIAHANGSIRERIVHCKLGRSVRK